MDWWVQNHADDHSNRVAQALMESGSLCDMTTDMNTDPADSDESLSDPEQFSADLELSQVDPDQSSAEPDQQPADPEQNTALTQNKNAFIRILVIKLMMKTLDQAKMIWMYFENPRATIQRLTEKILADVEDANIDITAERVANLQAPIFKDLSKKFGSATGLLAAMEAGNTEVEKCIASLLIGHLTKQRGAIARFFI